MLRVGLTGGMASGKSTVTETWRAEGVPVVSADELARDVVQPGAPALPEIVARFGAGVLQVDGSLDRSVLAAKAFQSAEDTEALNAILHPRIRKAAQAAFLALSAQGHPVAVYDAPLLFEVGLDREMDGVVVVWATQEQQITRAKQRNGWSDSEVRQRLARQWSLQDKVTRADWIIDNSGTPAATRKSSLAVLAELRTLAQGSVTS